MTNSNFSIELKKKMSGSLTYIHSINDVDVKAIDKIKLKKKMTVAGNP